MEATQDSFEREYPLDPDQRVVYQIIIDRLADPDCVDPLQLLTADTGYGKSRIIAWVARYLYREHGLVAFINCPKTLISMWTNLMASAKVPVEAIMTFDKLAGRDKTGCKHPYLVRTNGSYSVTKTWIDLVDGTKAREQATRAGVEYDGRGGIFLIADESQLIKNKTSARHWSFFELVKSAVIKPDEWVVRGVHLSASPIDKRENWECLFRNMGLIQGKELYKVNPGRSPITYQNCALGWLFDHTTALGEGKIVGRLRQRYVQMRTKDVPDVFTYLWKMVYQYRASVPVKDPIYAHPVTGRIFERVRANYFITLNEKGVALAEQAMTQLRRGNIIRQNGQINLEEARSNFGLIQKALVNLCSAKIEDLARIALLKLEEGKKIIICCPFKDDQKRLMLLLEVYRPVLLNGDTVDRDKVTGLFNSDSTECMVIIMTPKVGGVGVSLDDKIGTFRRVLFYIPTYEFLDIFQAFGRLYRRGMMSDTEAYIVYCNNTASIEAILLNSLAKSKVAESVIVPGSGRVFPGGYDFLIEDEDPQNPVHANLRQRLNQEKALAARDLALLQEQLLDVGLPEQN